MKIIGTITSTGVLETFGENGKKRVVLIEGMMDGHKEEGLFAFDTFADKAENFEKYQSAGDKVEADFYINCREYNGKYYTNLSLGRVDVTSKTTPAKATAPEPIGNVDPINSIVGDNEDNLPF